MDNTAALMSMIIFSAIGMGYLMYGRKEQKGVALLAGLLLCVFPYFVSNIWLSCGIGTALTLLPLLIRY